MRRAQVSFAVALAAAGPALLGGCNMGGPALFGYGAGIEGAAIPIIHRTVTDAVVSAVTQHDCSVVRLDQGLSYCKPYDPPPPPLPYCTRSLGVVDCWQDPALLPHPIPPEVADGPRTLTPEQEQNRTRWLPFM